jgi:hypothetical protein
LQDLGAEAFRQPQHVDGAVYAGLGRLHRIVLIMDRGGWAGQVIDLVGFNIERKGNVVPDDFKITVIEQALEVTTRASEIIVNANDVRPMLEQTLAEMGAEKSGASSNQYTRFKVQF